MRRGRAEQIDGAPIGHSATTRGKELDDGLLDERVTVTRTDEGGRLHIAKDHAACGVRDHDPLSERVERGRESIRRRDGRGLASRGPVDRATESIDARADRARPLADLAPESGSKRVEARRGAALSREEEESGAERHHDARDRYHPHCVQASCVDSSATSTSSSSAFPDGWPPVTM